MRLSRSGRKFLPSITYFKGFSHVEMFSPEVTKKMKGGDWERKA
jgi:hypothetical protein